MVLVNPIYSLEETSSYNQLCLENPNFSSCLPSLTPSPTESKEQPSFSPSEEEKQALLERLNSEIAKWMDLSAFCQSVRNIVEVEEDISFFQGKRCLEIGFTTGLPAIYALEKFAESVMVVCPVRTLSIFGEKFKFLRKIGSRSESTNFADFRFGTMISSKTL
jgi:hypothetical protein